MTKSTATAFVDLERAAIGRPVTRLGISFFPVYLMDNRLPDIATGPDSGRVIDELADASVPALTAVNPTDRPILLVEGAACETPGACGLAQSSILVLNTHLPWIADWMLALENRRHAERWK